MAFSSDCIFCKIAAGTIPARTEYADELCLAFHDVNPQAPTHLLVIPRQHLVSLAHCAPQDAALLGHLLQVAAELSKKLELSNGFRAVLNSGADGGQTVDHLHVHLLAGRTMHWPPG